MAAGSKRAPHETGHAQALNPLSRVPHADIDGDTAGSRPYPRPHRAQTAHIT
jgi:hypothetical protein